MTGMSNSVRALRRERAVNAWSSLDAVVVVGAGRLLSIPGGQDQTYPFRVHPDYRWLTGRDGADGVVAYDPQEGWTDFVPDVTELERLWEGREQVDEPGTRSLNEFAPWLGARSGRNLAALGVAPDGVIGNAEISRAAAELLLHARRPKDQDEIALVTRAVEATVAGYSAARAAIRPGATERLVQIELEAAMFRAGAEDVGYGTLVGSGPNSAVLHFAPSSRAIGADEFVLVDAGGAIGGYTADVTRTFSASGRFTPERKDLYDAVLRAQIECIDRCRVGVEWRDVHAAAAQIMAEGLVSMGVLRGSASAAVEREAIAVFFPHGVGHMVGLGVRDAGGRLPGAPQAPKCCGVTLRVNLPLEPNYLMTVEPGLYFVPALLRDPVRRERFSDCVNWSLVDRFLAMGLGGVRIEDNVLVTADKPRVLTAAIAK